MKLRDLFVADVTRDIPPVVYFHEQSPEKLKAEVSEYIITGGFAMAIASAAAAIGQSRAIVAALEGIARQPTAAPRIQVAMIIGLALIESLAIYVLLISLIVFFVKPFGG